MHRTGNATTTELFFDVLVVRDCIQPTHGVLAPNAKLRREIVPSPPEQATAPACDHAQGAPTRLSWARLLKRVFDIDIEHCPNCGGSLKIIAAIEDPPVIVKILSSILASLLGFLPSPDYPARSRQHVRRNRQTDLLGGF